MFESAAVASPDQVRHEIVKAFIILTEETITTLSALGVTQRVHAEAELIVEIQVSFEILFSFFFCSKSGRI